jgi:hypothetical protein
MIQTEPEDLERIRERLRKMTDHELREYGRDAASMADPKKNFGPPNPAFKIQLDEARAEWRRSTQDIHRCNPRHGSSAVRSRI